MERTTVVVTVALMFAALAAVPVMGLAASGGALMDTHENEADQAVEQANETAPGEQLSGVVGVGEAELEGEVNQRTFGIQVAQAQTEQAQADIVGEQLNDVEQRLAALEERKAELDEKRDAGEIGEGKYRAEVSKIAAQTETAKQLTNQSAQAADQLPADVLEERLTDRGIDVNAVTTLMDRANELSGGEVADIARDIAGPAVGQTPGVDRPVDVPDRPERPDSPADDDSDRPSDGTGNQSERP